MAGFLGGAGRARRSRRKLEKRVSAGRIRRGDGTGRATGSCDLEYIPSIQLTTGAAAFPQLSRHPYCSPTQPFRLISSEVSVDIYRTTPWYLVCRWDMPGAASFKGQDTEYGVCPPLSVMHQQPRKWWPSIAWLRITDIMVLPWAGGPGMLRPNGIGTA